VKHGIQVIKALLKLRSLRRTRELNMFVAIKILQSILFPSTI
jgi:hypothetical protein